jgi:ABC-type multidrug transport system fused ATPase/permease subunit
LRLHEVSLAFDRGRRPALTRVSLDIAAGTAVALVGPSGSGKSSILNLIMGFARPDKGQVLVGNTPLAQIQAGSWRDCIAWIGQNPVLFPGTIAANIRLGRPRATDAEVARAADQAGVMAFAAGFARQLETEIGEQGVGLSRGQAQRVALARVLLKDAPVLLLDEPTAGLDPQTEAQVMETVAAIAKGRTVVMATHSPAPWVDRVVVLANGCLW